MLNKDIYQLFACLCGDLGLRVSNSVTNSQLQDARNALLLAAESETTDGWDPECTRTFQEKFRICFPKQARRFSKPWRPRVFRDCYQAVSFPLKVKTEYTTQQENEFIQRFLQNEKSCSSWWRADFARSELFRLARHAVRLAGQHWDLRPESLAGNCRHGPGAVAQSYKRDDKNCFSRLWRIPYQLASWSGYYPYYANDRMWHLSEKEEAFFMDWGDLGRLATSSCEDAWYPWSSAVSSLKTGTVADRVISRLSLVPKDWKGPRGVFISPVEAMWVQLGIWETIRQAIPHTWLSCCYDPASQLPSRELCYQGSISKCVATLDLSDASDRIPAVLVRMLFHPQDWAAFAASRPSAVQLLDGSLRKLHMFAPMGDGKTFPILTIVCAAICLATLLIEDGWVAARPPTEGDLRSYASRIRVFGDDLIVPSEYYAAVCTNLQACNLKVNISKSYVKGYFRESCGLDSYKGLDCTPLRLRFQPVRRPDWETAAKAVDLHNRVYRQRPDLTNTIRYLERYVQRSRWHTGYTTREDLCPALLACRSDEFLSRNWFGRRPFAYNPALTRWEVKVPTRCEPNQLISLNPWWDFNHWLLTNHDGLPPGVIERSTGLLYAERRQLDSGAFRDSCQRQGSCVASQQYADLFLAGQWGTSSERAGCQLSWVWAI